MIAGALFRSGLSIRRRFINSLFNVARLLGHFANHSAGVGVKNAIAIHISDVTNRGAHAFLKVKLRVAGNFSGNHDEVPFGECFARDAAQRVLLETRVENVIADCIADFIGMAFGDGLRRKNVMAGHD